MQSSQFYDNYWAEIEGWKPTDGLDEELKRWFGQAIAPGQVVVDIGCGDGCRYGEYLAHSGLQLFGIDVSPIAVAEACRHGIQAQCASLENPLPFESSRFDAAICLEVFEHLTDPLFAAREICRILRPGGHLVASVPNVGAWRNRLELCLLGRFNPGGSPITGKLYPWRDPHVRFFNHTSIAGMLTEAGFSIDRVGGLDVQFLGCAPILRDVIRLRPMKPVASLCEALGRRFYRLLSGRCVVVAHKRADAS